MAPMPPAAVSWYAVVLILIISFFVQPSMSIYCDDDDCYVLLRVTQSYSSSEIKKAYCKLSLKQVLEGMYASYVEAVPFKQTVMFTLFRFVYFLICFGVTWIPIAGILFPLLFFILTSVREHVLPKFFPPYYLQALDAAEYE